METRTTSEIRSLNRTATHEPKTANAEHTIADKAMAGKTDNVRITVERDKKRRLQVKGLPTFDGAWTSTDGKNDIEEFLHQINHCYSYTDSTEDELLLLLPSILKGKAYKWFCRTDIARTCRNWKDWQEALRYAFTPPDYQQRMRMENARCHIEEGERLIDFCDRKVDIVEKCYGRDIDDALRVQEVYLSLPDGIRGDVRAAMGSEMNNISLDDFNKLLEELDPIAAGSQHDTIYQQDEERIAKDDGADELHNDTDSDSTDAEDQQTDKTQPKAMSDEDIATYHASRSEQQDFAEQHYHGTENPLPCFHCGNYGHWSDHCQSFEV